MSAALPGDRTNRGLVKLAAGLAVGAVVAVACAPASTVPAIPVKQRGTLLVEVVDSLYDAGRASSVQIDKDGSPAISYLLYQPVLKKGQIPPGVKVGDPQPPAVILATQASGIWTRVSVTPQKRNPTAGDAPYLADSKGHAIPGVGTSLAVDSQGKHHVAWSSPQGGVYYADDASGSFGTPDQVTAGAAYGTSIAVASDGTPWISYYSGGNLKVASRSGTSWTEETVQANAGPATTPATVTAIRVGSDGQPIVAYGDHGRTVIATRSGGTWSTQAVTGDGGYGVSLALDKGAPHVAYYDAAGGVHHATSSTVDNLGSVGAGPSGGGDARWSTGIAIDQSGATYVTWADTSKNEIRLATRKETGAFTSRVVPSGTGGSNPSIAVSVDGKSLALAWFDAPNSNLDVAESSSGPLQLAHALPTLGPPSSAASATPTASGAPPPCSPSGTTVQVSAQNIAFDKTCLAAPAGQAFTIQFDNKDTGVMHNVAIYQGPGATGPLFQGEIFAGPDTKSYQVNAIAAGTYYFQCDVHGAAMSGTFVVAKG